jgi:hypothetical protein
MTDSEQARAGAEDRDPVAAAKRGASAGREAPARRPGTTRAQALRAAAGSVALVGAGALAGGWAGPDATAGRPSRTRDVRILNFLLVLEELQVAFYGAALRGAGLRGDLLRYARTVEPQEREHADLLRRLLGRDARPAPMFAVDQSTAGPERFRAAASQLEETVAAAYIGQGASLTRGAIADAARVVAVEARHAAWIRDIAGVNPAPRAADPGRSAEDVLSELRREGFLR